MTHAALVTTAMDATETSAGSAFSVAKRNTEVQIVSLRRCESVKYLRARVSELQ
jgi:hypothetical protein